MWGLFTIPMRQTIQYPVTAVHPAGYAHSVTVSHEWQSQVDNKHYSVAYFDPITFVKGGAVTCSVDV